MSTFLLVFSILFAQRNALNIINTEITTIECIKNNRCYDDVIAVVDENMFLVVSCEYCNDKTIICPMGGCNITCSGSYGCEGATIQASTALNVHIHCKSDAACKDLTVNAPFANSLSINCSIDSPPDDYEQNLICDQVMQTIRISFFLSKTHKKYRQMEVNASNVNTFSLSCQSRFDETNSYQYDNACYDIEINADNANKVRIFSQGTQALYDSSIRVNNVNDVRVTSFGQFAFHDSYLYAQYVSYLGLTCSSNAVGGTDGACVSNKYYIPSQRLELECAGRGCQRLGTIYLSEYFLSKLDPISFSVNGCDQCESVRECINYFQIYCDDQANDDSFGWNVEGKCDADNCGCQSMMDEVTFFTETNSLTCYDAYMDSISISSENDSDEFHVEVWHIIVGVCIVIFVSYTIKRWHAREKRRREREEIASPNNSVTQGNAESHDMVQQSGNTSGIVLSDNVNTGGIVPSAPTMGDELPSYNDVSNGYNGGGGGYDQVEGGPGGGGNEGGRDTYM